MERLVLPDVTESPGYGVRRVSWDRNASQDTTERDSTPSLKFLRYLREIDLAVEPREPLRLPPIAVWTPNGKYASNNASIGRRAADSESEALSTDDGLYSPRSSGPRDYAFPTRLWAGPIFKASRTMIPTYMNLAKVRALRKILKTPDFETKTGLSESTYVNSQPKPSKVRRSQGQSQGQGGGGKAQAGPTNPSGEAVGAASQ